MSYSTRSIALPAPPVSTPIRNLGLLLWFLPILLSSLTLVLSPLSARPSPVTTLPRADLSSKREPRPDLPVLEAPQTFARATDNWEDGVIKPLPVGLGPRFQLQSAMWASTAFTPVRHPNTFDDTATDIARAPRSPGPIEFQVADIREASRVKPAGEGRMRDFQKVKVVGATMLHADNINILLAGVEPLPEGATCRRLDGVMQSCAERAQHRLAVLLQARNISCQMSRQLESGVFVARCLADKIDLAGDLLRQKLVQTPSSTLASN